VPSVKVPEGHSFVDSNVEKHVFLAGEESRIHVVDRSFSHCPCILAGGDAFWQSDMENS